mmetsp:Transcript_29924/g.69468  ORF Transcript_29924/g.69468 Transcript_29924/m.69468 type:complete len:228 (+) Transcript_29924:773-1456(+)
MCVAHQHRLALRHAVKVPRQVEKFGAHVRHRRLEARHRRRRVALAHRRDHRTCRHPRHRRGGLGMRPMKARRVLRRVRHRRTVADRPHVLPRRCAAGIDLDRARRLIRLERAAHKARAGLCAEREDRQPRPQPHLLAVARLEHDAARLFELRLRLGKGAWAGGLQRRRWPVESGERANLVYTPQADRLVPARDLDPVLSHLTLVDLGNVLMLREEVRVEHVAREDHQ